MMQKLGNARRSSDANQPTRPPSAIIDLAIKVPNQCIALPPRRDQRGSPTACFVPALGCGIGARIGARLRPKTARSRASFRSSGPDDQGCGTGSQHSTVRRRSAATWRRLGRWPAIACPPTC